MSLAHQEPALRSSLDLIKRTVAKGATDRAGAIRQTV